MPINIQNLLSISKGLLNSATGNEDYFRSSSSRAYYSAFHACSEAAKSELGQMPQQGQNFSFGHTELYDLFLNHKPPLVARTKRDADIWRIGYLLKQARDLRVHADYKSGVFSLNDAQETIDHIEEILQLIKGL
ncbi:TPA: hypothetical protein ACGAPA_001452 [Legionella pneumophila]|uniref:hypothetical protein n=1 Tax=Legionella septentrionalis TaxID=2498109 RepID=UPI0013151DAC|nr:hypothetical protein [Legionella septentrionalis]HAT8369674.1 hypothetical protein [Legionella pneumophila]HCC0378739.1 hypothetical protein [Legionella pneumophila]HEJ6634893.1 hypothetical protein [Legionella pneumophila]HEK3834986.1 hypothetical protein [Legionella pneumophila]HEM6983898.1 hypothetical protein [Legionella pneumophila]